MPSVHLYRVCHILIWRAIPRIYRLPLGHHTDHETNISVVSGSGNIVSTGPYYDSSPSISTTIICALYGVISISILFFVSNNSYIAIYIEWKYKNDTSFDDGIHFHVNTMVLKCKCF